MGNSIRHVLGNNGIPRFPCRLQLGTSVAIDLSTSSENKDGRLEEYYSVLYTIDGSTCNLKFQRLVHDGNVRTLYFELSDRKYLKFDKLILNICVKQTNLPLRLYTWDTTYVTVGVNYFPRLSIIGDVKWTKTNKTNDACGGLTETNVYFYGSGNKVCLVVLECKNPRNITRRPLGSIRVEVDAVTVAHYFANSSGTAFKRTETDIGFSVIAKYCLSSNGKLDTTVEGPVQHPAPALLYMFDQVYETGIWKPKMCPHCDSIQRGRMFWQSDSEDSDSNLIPPGYHSGQQNGTSITNGGRFKGNGTGCIINKNKIVYKTGNR